VHWFIRIGFQAIYQEIEGLSAIILAGWPELVGEEMVVARIKI